MEKTEMRESKTLAIATVFLAVFFSAAAVATLLSANPYQGIRYAETEGQVYHHLSGEFSVAATTATWSTYTITLDGADGSVSASSATFIGGPIYLSTSTTSSDKMCFLGAVAALPTSGYPRGCLLYLTTDPTKIYVSTQTVVGTQSWLGK